MMLTDDQKSPIYIRLEAMIDTLAKVRAEMKGSRVPAYEQNFIMRKKKEAAFMRKETKRAER